jgi:hypothetical protein
MVKKCKKCKKKNFIFLRGEGGLKPCEGEKGAGERGNPRGERGAGGSKQTFIRIWLEYSNWERRKQSKEEKRKDTLDILLRQICILGAFIIEWGIHSVTEPASDFSHIPWVGNRCAPPRVKNHRRRTIAASLSQRPSFHSFLVHGMLWHM